MWIMDEMDDWQSLIVAVEYQIVELRTASPFKKYWN